ncbi:hypothetical protein [Psittacicella hinzii]|uniref:Uncharacterized protein n=1 Tax=Psittacicella hinzii TaxID=2028575 RepID=A0A3A1YKN2_9GAMM|nr:hypothetical protein [Psittacicella hinzii]RIY38823.1 hypothetical protein CKF58_03340 [Psittacicella hinzii]
MLQHTNSLKLNLVYAEIAAHLPTIMIHLDSAKIADNFLYQPFVRYLRNGNFHEIHATSYEQIAQQTGMVFDENAYNQHQIANIQANDYTKRQSLAHLAAWQHIANDPALFNQDWVLVLQDDISLEKQWLQKINFALAFFQQQTLENTDLTKVKWINLLDTFYQQHELNDPPLEKFAASYKYDLAFAKAGQHYLRLTEVPLQALGAYLIRKSAVPEFIARAQKISVSSPALLYTQQLHLQHGEIYQHVPSIAVPLIADHNHLSLEQEKQRQTEIESGKVYQKPYLHYLSKSHVQRIMLT